MCGKGAAVEPLVPGHAPIAVLPQLQRFSSGIAHLDDVAGLGEIEELSGVVRVEV